jgi:WD40 repeat protein
MSAIGTGSVVKTGIVNASPAAVHPKTVSKSTWGVSSDVIFLGSHLGDVIQAVVHPSDSLGLAASLDTQGVVLIWDSAGYSRPQVSVTNVNLPVWKLVGRLDTHIVPRTLNFNLIAWAPILLHGDKAVLVIVHSERIDCYLICKNSLKGKSGFISDHLLSLQGLGLGFRDGHELEGICAVPVPMVEDQQPDNTGSKFLVLGIGGGGSILASWIVEIQVMMGSAGTKGVSLLETSNHLETRAAERIEIQDSTGHTSADFLDSKPDHLQKLGFTLYTGVASQNARIYTRENFIGSISLASQQHVKCIASAVGTLFPLEMPRSSSHPYDVLIGCGDGTIRLYKAQSFKDAASLSGSQEDCPIFWQCVGSIKVHLGPVSKVASSGSGGKFASASNIEGCIVKIWDAESYIANIKFGLEVQISVPGQVTALSWLDVGNGIPLLGVATDGGFRIFIQSNCLSGDKCTTRSSNWVCLASSTLHVTSFLWDTQGSPIVVSRGNLLALSLWVSATSQQNHQMMDLKLTTKSGLMSSVNGGPSSNVVVARELPRLRMREPCTILEAAELFTYPLPDYHPTAIVWSLYKGIAHI